MPPSAAVLVASVRPLNFHGGVRRRDLTTPDAKAVVSGGDNLIHLVGIVRGFGLPCVVAINRFGDDTTEELAAVKQIAMEAGATAAAIIANARTDFRIPKFCKIRIPSTPAYRTVPLQFC